MKNFSIPEREWWGAVTCFILYCQASILYSGPPVATQPSIRSEKVPPDQETFRATQCAYFRCDTPRYVQARLNLHIDIK